MNQKSFDGLPYPARLGAILTIALALTMSVLDSVIANVALPTIATELNTSSAKSIWIINSYQIAIIISLLPFSFIGERIGYRRIYQFGLVVFCITSVFCALSNSIETLTVARILQGLGASAIMSVNIALVRLIYPKKYLGRGLGVNSFIVATSAASGPTIAALILSIANWQWLFLINAPIGIIALILALKFLPPNPSQATKSKLDLLSVILNALFFGLLISIISGFSQKVSSPILITEAVLFIIISFYFIRRQLRLENPLLPIDLLKIPIFTLSICTSVCSFSAQMLAYVSLPFLMQNVLGKTEVETGLLLTPWPVAVMILAPISGYLIGRIHAGILGGIGLLTMAVGLIMLYFLPENPSSLNIIIPMFITGAGFGLFQSPNNFTIISSAPQNRSASASAMLGTARLLGQSLGTALVALMFNLFPEAGTKHALILASFFAITAAIVSSLRVTQK